MTKRDILKWLQTEKQKQLRELKTKYRENMQSLRTQILTEMGFFELADNFQAKLEEALVLWKAWQATQEAAGKAKIRDCYSECPNNRLYPYVREKGISREKLNQYISLTSEQLTKAISDWESHSILVEQNYTSLIFSVSTMRAKDAIPYLQELGFDLTELEKQTKPKEQTALVVPIDTQYLFPGRESA